MLIRLVPDVQKAVLGLVEICHLPDAGNVAYLLRRIEARFASYNQLF